MLRVLTYHRVLEAADARVAAPGLVSASPRAFAAQMDYVARHYHVVRIDDVLEALACGRPLRHDAVLLTFDDGYRDFADVVWPILRERRLPAVLFVPTAFAERSGQVFWWDRLAHLVFSSELSELRVSGVGTVPLGAQPQRIAAFRRIASHVKSLPNRKALDEIENLCAVAPPPANALPAVLCWEELRRLSAAGVSVAPHTRTHPLLTRVPDRQVEDEVAGSLADVRREIGKCPPVFCYPGGDLDDAVVATVGRCGVSAAFTVLDGHNDMATVDRLRMRRTNITPRTTRWVFRVRLTRPGAAIDVWRHSRRARNGAQAAGLSH